MKERDTLGAIQHKHRPTRRQNGHPSAPVAPIAPYRRGRATPRPAPEPTPGRVVRKIAWLGALAGFTALLIASVGTGLALWVWA